MENKKVCPKCLKKKSREDFKPRPDGSISYCYTCEIEYYRTYNAKRYASEEARRVELERTKKKYRDKVRPARMERKKRLIIMMGGACAFCKYNKSAAALDFDHIDPTTKVRTISHLLAISQPWAWEAALEEAKKCRLLCSNCHRERTYPDHDLRLESESKPQVDVVD